MAPEGKIVLSGRTDDSPDPNRNVSVEQCHGVVRGELGLWIYGRIHYRDVFEQPHVTNFRFQYYSKRGRQGLNVCREGNEAD